MTSLPGGSRSYDIARHERTEGVTLVTEDRANVRFYERLGYGVVGHARVAPGLETWGLFRGVSAQDT